MIDCAFFGFLARDAEPRTSQAGKPWVRLSVGVGKDENVQWVSVAVFGKAADIAATLVKGDRCYIEGTLKLDTWRGSDGNERHGLSVAAFKCERTHNIGRNRPKRDDQPKPSPDIQWSQGGRHMARAASSKVGKIEHPQSHYATPDELIEDRALSFEEKLDALRVWEQDARQMLTASGEGMPGSEEGTDRNDHPMLGQVGRAKDKLQRSVKPEVSRGRA